MFATGNTITKADFPGNFTQLLVPHATVVQTKCEAKNSRNLIAHENESPI